MKQTKTNILRVFLALFLGLLWMPNVVQAQVIEDGTAEHPFLIESEQELWDFHDCMVPGGQFYFDYAKGTFTTTKPEGIEDVNYRTIPTGCAKTYVKLITDIVMNKGNVAGCQGTKDSTWKVWIPMGIFTGHFDGDYHIISGLYCTERDKSAQNERNERGFFTQVNDNATVKHLGVTNSYISGAKAVGGICGWLLRESVIDGCFFEGTLESMDINSGGIVGISQGASEVKNCYSTGQIYSTSRHVGGIVGQNFEGSTITNCYSNMMIQSEGSLTSAICGFNNDGGDITNCYYDKQLSTLNTNFLATGMLTQSMTSGSWTVLGEQFNYTNGIYPYIKGFDLNKPSVVMSVIPFILCAVSDVDYDDVDHIDKDFDLGTRLGITWIATSWNDCMSVDNVNQKVSIYKEGIADLMVKMDTMTRTYVLFPNKAPFLGSEENPFLIENLEHLTTFQKGINGGVDFIFRRFKVDYSNLENIHWKQVDEIDLASIANWTPIGNSSTPFKGYYDGGKKKIINMKISNGSNLGLFGNGLNATIKNSIVDKGNVVSNGDKIAGLAGTFTNSNFSNCSIIDSRIEGTNANNTAGIVAFARNCTITSCHNRNTDVIGYIHAAGISAESSGTISYCSNSGSITTTRRNGGDGAHGAGIATAHDGTILFCYNTGSVFARDCPAGICSWGNTRPKVYYCFNTGEISATQDGDVTSPTGGIAGWQVDCYYCFNTGTINGSFYSPGGTGGIAGGNCSISNCCNFGNVIIPKGDTGGGIAGHSNCTSQYSFNVNRTCGEGFVYPIGASSVAYCFYDKQKVLDYERRDNSIGYSSLQLIGENSEMRSTLGTDYWIYEEGMYPRLKWTDTVEWARDIAIAACTPVLLSSEEEDVNNVKPGMKLYGCDSNVVWRQMPQEAGVQGGSLFVNLEEDYQTMTCADNATIPRLKDVCIGTTTIGAYVNDILVKTVTLRRYVESTKDTLTIDNFADLDTLRKGVNSGEAFYYKDYLLPRFADSVHFRVTTDIEMPNSNWVSIGGVDRQCRFGGTVLGEGHTISNLHANGTYAGLFGICTGSFYDLNLTDVNISGGSYRGALCAKITNGKVLNCTAEGTISGGSAEGTTNNFFTGGIVGHSLGIDTIQNCVNRITVTVTGDYSRSGGIVGYGNAITRVINCHNEAPITSNYRVGGIIGEGGTTQFCYNTGEVTGNSNCEYIGGVCGSGTANYCYNMGTITAKPGNSTSNHYVGGVCGSGNASYSYNAGIVYGNNRKYVGGISGSGNPSYCYNSNTARSTGVQLGGVVGAGSPSHCYYDKQLCPEGGVNRADVAGKAEGMTTEEMLSYSLRSLLVPSGSASSSPWQFETLLYPQLSAFAGTDPSLSSVMPVSLSTNETWKAVSKSFYMHGCDQGDWIILQGKCVELDTVGHACQTNVSGTGVVQLGSMVNGKTYRIVRLLVNIDENSPLIVKNLQELKNFRDVINGDIGFYNMADSTYHKMLTSADSAHIFDFMEIQNGGLDLHFKQSTDIDMSGESGSWQPIADYNTNNGWVFQGTYNGAGHTISGLKLMENMRYRGLFGRNSGVIRNLTVTSAQMSSNSQYKGLLCGMNYGGLIDNCAVTYSKVIVASSYTGVLCGANSYADIRHCNVTQDTLQSTGECTGGICGYNEYAVVDSCSGDKLYVTGAGNYKGGIVGYNHRGKIYHSDILNSQMDVTGTDAGGICGYSYSEDSGNPAYIQYCSNRNTTIKSTNVRVGGILGYNYYRYVYVTDCYVTGGSVSSTSNSVGGICGQQYYYNTDNKVICCVNENPVKGNDYVGGITGYLNQARIDSSENRASVTGAIYVGGILGYAVNYSCLTHTVNRGNVMSSGNYVGGIQGYMYNSGDSRVMHSYNMGRVQGTNSVGGIVGQIMHGAVQNSYNVGIVKGVAQVGGLLGSQGDDLNENTVNSYNAGWVYGVSMVGAICGYSPIAINKFANCAYDVQMCPMGGVNNVDFAATKPLLTTELASNEEVVRNLLGTTDWVYTEGMYPRLTKIDRGKAALASVLPVYLTANEGDTVYANDVPVGHYMLSGCNQDVSWIRYQGYGLSITGCDLNAIGRNYVQIANMIDEDTLKVVQLVLGISEENPLEIVSLEQFRKFRDLINSNQTFYFDDENKIFYASEGEDYIQVDPCGEHMFFKLMTDVNLSLESDNWTPIGDYATNSQLMFKGHFNGDGHRVIGITSTSNKAYQGLFGYLRGTIKNLRMVETNINGTGDYYGVIAGYNYGTILNCSSIGGWLKGRNYVGGITGYNSYDQVFNSYNSCNVTGSQCVGGITGASWNAGIISQCFNAGIINATSSDSYVGGITGSANTEVSNCYNVGAITGKNRVGGIVGWSQNKWIYYCYNAGIITSLSAEPSNVGAIAASDNATYYPYYCFYDQQMSCQDGGIGNGTTQLNSSNRTTAKFMLEMVGNRIAGTNGLSDTYWTFTDSLYPRLKSLKKWDGSTISVQPLYIPENLKCTELELPFIAKTNDSIQWSHYGSGYALNTENLSKGKVGIAICGFDTLIVKKNDDIRIVPVEVLRMAATTVVDTACDGFYVWTANGRVYTESCEATIALTVTEGCDSIMKLKLTIPPSLQIKMDSKNYNCHESTDAYAEATVTGGFAKGYIYVWTNESGDTISMTNRIDNPGPGTYHFSVCDQVHPDCEKSADVTITQPDKLVLTSLSFDGQCYNQNDGYIKFSVAGGSMPYKVDWGSTDTMAVSHAVTDTITGLAAGTYTVQVTDAHGCTKKSESITLEEDATEYAISAFGVNKMYDGVAVNPNQYILKIGENKPDTIASGSFKELANGDTLRATVSYTGTNVKDVMSATNEVVTFSITKDGVDQTCRYNVTSQNSNIIISKRNVTLTSASDQKAYDGTPLTNHAVIVGGSGFVDGEDTLSCTVTGSQIVAGASANIFTYALNDNTKESNYDITKVEGQLVVATDGSVVVIANSNTKKYDGKTLVDSGYTYILPEAGAEYANDTLIVKIIGDITNVGTVVNRVDSATIVIKDKTTGEDHTSVYTKIDPVVHGTLTVTQRNVTLSTVSDSKVYDGTPLSRLEVTLSGDGFVEGEVTSYTATNSITNVGTISNAITITEGAGYLADNYNLEKNEGTLTITKRSLTIVGETRYIDYDGQAHTLTSFAVPNMVVGHTISGITYAASGTQTGTYTGSFTGTAVIKDVADNDVTANYDITPQPGTLSIGQTILPLVVKSNTNHFVYDGQPHTYQNYTVLYNGESLTPTFGTTYTLPTGDVLTVTPTLTGSTGITHVRQNGEKNNTFAINLAHSDHYSVVTMDTGKIVIDKRMVSLRSKNDWKIYDGTPLPSSVASSDQSVERSGVGFVTMEGVACMVTGSQTEVGSSENTFDYVAMGSTDLNDYNIETHYGNLTVAPATLTVAAIDVTKKYGEENPALHYSITGFVHGEDTTSAPFIGTARPVLNTTAETISPAGNYPIIVDLTGVQFNNYVLMRQDGILKINRRLLTIQALSVDDVTYNGRQHTWQESVAPHYQLVDGDLLEHDTVTSVFIAGARTISGTTQIELNNVIVKHYEVNGEDTTWTDVTQSYEMTYLNGTITINPVEIKLKPLPYTHEFDGQTYSSANTEAPHFVFAEGTALVGKDSIVVLTINGCRSSFGKTPFVIDSASIKIVDTSEVHDYSDLQPSQLRNGGYQILLLTDTLNITHRETKYEVTMVGKDTTYEYSGAGQLLSGWRNNVFERDGFTYHVENILSQVERENVGTYSTEITGETKVYGSTGEDVTEEFVVHTTPGTLTITQKPIKIVALGVRVEYDFLTHSYRDNTFPYAEAIGICPGQSISEIQLTGERAAVGRTPIVIMPNSVKIKHNMSGNDLTANYSFTYVDSAIHILNRTTKDTFLLVSKSQTDTYDGEKHTVAGFDTLRFMVRAHDVQQTPVYFHIDQTSVSATTETTANVGQYKNVIMGTPVVLDENNQDVSGSFVVLADTGQLTINQRSIIVTGRDTSFYYDGMAHNASQMSTPRYTIDSLDLVSGHNLTAVVTSASISELDATTPTVVETVIITDAGSNDVTANYAVTKVDGMLKIEGFPGVIVITSASAEIECTGQPQKRDEYMVTYDDDPLTAVTGSNGLRFAMPTATKDTLTITPTFAGVTTPSENADSNNVFTYALQNDTKYVGTRTIVRGTIRMYDSLKVVVTSMPVTCNGLNDGKADITITGGKKKNGNYSYELDDGTEINITGTVNLTNLTNGSHTFYVKDSLSYDKTVTFTIEQPDVLTLALTSDNPVCEDGSVMSFTTGGNGGIKFKLNDAAKDDLGIYNHLSVGAYTVTITDSKGCSATQSVTLTAVETAPIVGITRGGEITSYAPDTTVNASGDCTDFPALTPSGEIIAKPKLSNCTVTVDGHKVSVSVNVEAIGTTPVLELEVATNNAFDATTLMFTHKVVLSATGTQSHDFENLPSGTYYVRAKLYNCSGSIVSESQTAVVE